MAEQQMTVGDEEREFLKILLETALRDARVEEHHTFRREYRQHVIRHEQIIEGLLKKLEPGAGG